MNRDSRVVDSSTGFLLGCAIGALILCPTRGAAQSEAPVTVETLNIPATPDRISEPLSRIWHYRSARLVAWESVGTGLYVTTRFGESDQLHRIDSPLGARNQVTFGWLPPIDPVVSPGGRMVAYNLRSGDDGSFAVFLTDELTGRVTRVSPEGRSAQLPRWSSSGAFLSWFSPGNEDHYVIYRASVDDLDVHEEVFSAPGVWAALDWSEDGSTALLFHYVSDQQSELHLLDVASGTMTRIGAPTDIGYFDHSARLTGETVIYVSDQDGGSRKLYGHDRASGVTSVLASADSRDIEAFALSPDGSKIAFVSDSLGRSRLQLVDRHTGVIETISGIPAGVIHGLGYSPSGDRLAFDISGSSHPADVYVAHLDSVEGVIERWTHSESRQGNDVALPEPRFFEYPGAPGGDGSPIRVPAFSYTPACPGPHPVLVALHGGPAAQAKVTYSPLVNHWVRSHCVAVIFPNYRGSTGYGSAYTRMDDGYGRDAAIDDVGALLDWLETRPEFDSSRVMTYGHSYGGYLSLMAAVRFGERLVGAVSEAGPTDLVSLIEDTEEAYRAEERQEFGDERDPAMRAFLKQISPLTHASEITVPVLVAHGGLDRNVGADQAETLVQAMIDAGQSPWYLFAPQAGHIFDQADIEIALAEAVTMFIDQHLARD